MYNSGKTLKKWLREPKKKSILIAGGFVIMAFYIFGAARPIPEETALAFRWIHSLATTHPAASNADAVGSPLLAFELGERFGYVNREGVFTVNRTRSGGVSLSQDYWAEYGAIPDKIEVKDPLNAPVMTIEMQDGSRGYPFFLDKRMFLINSEQNSISALDKGGNVAWTYDFGAVVTCVDAAGGFLLAGSLDGVVEVLDGSGKRIFFFEPGGSRLSVIAGCAFSEDGSKIAIVSGVDEQRFLLMERLGDDSEDEYRVTRHEFLGTGFRRPVRVAFVDGGNRVVFEREGGIGIYELSSRRSLTLALDGEVAAVDEFGGGGLLFLLLAGQGGHKKLAAVKFPSNLMFAAPFDSEAVFLGRDGDYLYVGGGAKLVSFEIVKR
ncbi:MAG: WD40 repeat domain-containing protein [Treponema sp.]|jgi:hypothetical protein|nr:WD40 repeat domain-containing protein [Treponema sp.]